MNTKHIKHFKLLKHKMNEKELPIDMDGYNIFEDN